MVKQFTEFSYWYNGDHYVQQINPEDIILQDSMYFQFRAYVNRQKQKSVILCNLAVTPSQWYMYNDKFNKDEKDSVEWLPVPFLYPEIETTRIIR